MATASAPLGRFCLGFYPNLRLLASLFPFCCFSFWLVLLSLISSCRSQISFYHSTLFTFLRSIPLLQHRWLLLLVSSFFSHCRSFLSMELLFKWVYPASAQGFLPDRATRDCSIFGWLSFRSLWGSGLFLFFFGFLGSFGG